MAIFKKSGEGFLAKLFKHKQVEELAEELAHTYADEMQADMLNCSRTEQITGTKSSYTFSLPKIAWVRQNLPDVFEKVNRIMLMQDFVVYALTR